MMTRKTGHLLLATLIGVLIGAVLQSQSPQSFRENGNIQYKRTYKKVDAFTLTTATADTPIKNEESRR